MNNFIISDAYDKSIRKLFPLNCKRCNKIFYVPLCKINRYEHCSRACRFESLNKKLEVKCSFCSSVIEKKLSVFTKSKSKVFYCNRICQNQAATKSNLNCQFCNALITHKQKSKKFCSHKCDNDFKFQTRIEEWKKGNLSGISGEGCSSWLRKYLFIKYDNKCSECGWSKINQTTGKIPLQIDHIDGNFRNNKEDNLRLLCGACHSLTSTFGSLNKGKGGRTMGRNKIIAS